MTDLPKLTELARVGFTELSVARDRLGVLAELTGMQAASLLPILSEAADADTTLFKLLQLGEQQPQILQELCADSAVRLTNVCLLFGASGAFASFFLRHPELLLNFATGEGKLYDQREAQSCFLAAVAGLVGEQGWDALRISYRRLLADVMLWGLRQGRERDAAAQAAHFEAVSAALSHLAGAAIEAGLALARESVKQGIDGPPVSAERVAAVQLAVIGMGKCGAEELNVVSDVDVMFITRSAAEETINGESLSRVATRLARETMRAIHDPAHEPPLWQLDANLRPEGRQGPLVRTLPAMLSYYERWAKAWEFQALLKARALAGDISLGEEFVAATREAVWASRTREDFVGSVQRMRERVTEHIDPAEVDIQLKLGPGGLRDIEFSAQLLQLVHGAQDSTLHVRGTLPALRALVAGGYIAREDGDALIAHYCFLRLLEHRLQLRELRRTALMPRDEEELRVLARATGLAATGEELRENWERVKAAVRELHLKIFYAPLLSAVAALPDDGFRLGSEAAAERLESIGFVDAQGALRHLAALTKGTSRRAQIQRNLMPVFLRWLAAGTDPDYGLLAFRRLSEANEETPWYLRLLRDGSEAAERLMRVLSCSRFTAELLIQVPEAVAWLERDELLAPASLAALQDEMSSLASRRTDAAGAAQALRAVHRREVLRLALGRVTGVLDDKAVAVGLDAAHTALLAALLQACIAEQPKQRVSIALIGMGRFGGGEMGFASDLDLFAVYTPLPDVEPDAAARAAQRIVSTLRDLVDDPRFALDLDFDLRPEGKKGPLVRSYDSTVAYYQKWAETWEAQALLRARVVAGDEHLAQQLTALFDSTRYRPDFGDAGSRQVRAMKARVEAERLPQGADPKLHLKLGPGGISDVEWLVQLIQMQHGAKHAQLRTVQTLPALKAAEELGLLPSADAALLRASWVLASRIRNAIKLFTGTGSDVLPADWRELAGVSELLPDLPDGASALRELWLRTARRARQVFESEFFPH